VGEGQESDHQRDEANGHEEPAEGRGCHGGWAQAPPGENQQRQIEERARAVDFTELLAPGKALEPLGLNPSFFGIAATWQYWQFCAGIPALFALSEERGRGAGRGRGYRGHESHGRQGEELC